MSSPLSSGGMKSCKEEAWKGFIPVEFSLSLTDLTVHSIPDPVHVLVSRYTYLSVAASEMIEYFQRSAIDFSTDIWFDFNSIPLRSEFPVGVLYDLYCGGAKFKSPWKIVIHFQAYPRAVLIHKHVDVEKLFFHSMKQALFMLYGNARVFNDLSVENQQSIWKSVVSADVSLQETLFNTVLRLPKDQIKLIPIRLVTLAPASTTSSTASSMPMQPSTNSQGSTGSVVTLHTMGSASSSPPAVTSSGSVGESHAPVYSMDEVLSFAQRPVKPLAGTYQRPRTLREVLIEDFRQYALHQVQPSAVGSVSGARYTIQGMEVSLDLPVYELWCVLAHADMFLYITVSSLR